MAEDANKPRSGRIVDDIDNPMLLSYRDRGNPSALYPKVEKPEKLAPYLNPVNENSGWKAFVPKVPQLEGISSAAADIGGDIAWQLSTSTLEDEARRYDMPNDPYYHNLLMAGANAGGNGFFGISDMPFGVVSKGENRQLFRNGQIKELRAALDAAIANGKHARVIGHSWGGADIAGIAKDYPEIPFYALDPVSWGGRPDKLPNNLTVLRPKDTGITNPNDTVLGWLAAKVGGRWPKIEGGKTIYYDGGHVGGVGNAMNRIIAKEWIKRVRREGGYSERKYKIPAGEWMNKVFYGVYPRKKPSPVSDKANGWNDFSQR